MSNYRVLSWHQHRVSRHLIKSRNDVNTPQYAGFFVSEGLTSYHASAAFVGVPMGGISPSAKVVPTFGGIDFFFRDTDSFRSGIRSLRWATMAIETDKLTALGLKASARVGALAKKHFDGGGLLRALEGQYRTARTTTKSHRGSDVCHHNAAVKVLRGAVDSGAS